MGLSRPSVWAVVLIKDFETAKQRLAAALSPDERRDLARRNAGLALEAAGAADHVLAVCGSDPAAELARLAGAEVLVERRPAGQNPAARRGIAHAAGRGAGAVLLMSSDLPLVSRRAVRGMLARARRMGEPAALAAAAAGRAGTNALYLCPPAVLGLHFGDASLPKFAAEAAEKGVRFGIHESAAFALDLDEPSDLDALGAR